MFDNITYGGSGATARKGTSFVFSVVTHGMLVLLAIVFTVVKDRLPKGEEAVNVTFRSVPPPPPPPPPPKSRKKIVRPTPTRPIQPRPRINEIVQPKEIPKVEEKPPDNPPPVEDDDTDDEGVEGGVEGGVAGGVVGGVLGGVVGGQTGGTGPQEGPPLVLGGGMSRPYPSGSCRPPKPQMPEQARTMGISGLVLVEFVVHSDGRVGEVLLKNKSAAPILYDAVKAWLEGCTFTPSVMSATGKPVPVKMIQPFNFTLKG
jgi:periplasmic protein TonB